MIEAHDLLEYIQLTKERKVFVTLAANNIHKLAECGVVEDGELAFNFLFIDRNAVQNLIITVNLSSLFQKLEFFLLVTHFLFSKVCLKQFDGHSTFHILFDRLSHWLISHKLRIFLLIKNVQESVLLVG